jgi:hypothetical protein
MRSSPFRDQVIGSLPPVHQLRKQHGEPEDREMSLVIKQLLQLLFTFNDID